MKKSLLLLATLLSATMLASCDNESGEGGGNGSTIEPTDVVVAEDWSAEEKEAMNDVLGFELPYFHIEGAKFENYKNSMILVTMDSGATKDTLLAIEKAFKADGDFTVEYEVGGIAEQPNFGSYTYNYEIEVGENKYAGYVQYGIYTNEDDYGVATEGALEFAAFLNLIIEDQSAVYDTYDELSAATVAYFAKGGLSVELPATLSVTADTYELYDIRYVYNEYYGFDAGPYVSLYLNGALETDVEKVIKDFTDIGYALTSYTYGGDSYESYVKGDICVDVSFEEADTENDLPQAVTVIISEFVQDAE